MATKQVALSEEQMKSIDSYGKDIQHLEGTIAACRGKTSMYIGTLHETGLLTMFREIFQNAVDQLISDKSPCNHIDVIFDERDYKFVVSDNGMGIPHDWMFKIYTDGHTGSHIGKRQPGQYSAGTNGIGAKVVNALSDRFDAYSYHYTGVCKHLGFEKGELVVDEMLDNPEKLQGTRVEFKPDHTILGETPLDPGLVYTLVRDILSLLPIGSTISYTSINKKGKTYHEDMVNEHGIMTNVLGKCSSMLISPIQIINDNGTMKLECAFTFDQEDLGGEDITSYGNMCPTSAVPDPIRNTHVYGTLDGICTWFCNYMNKTYLTDRDKQKIKIIASDVKTGLKLMISAWHLDPEFTGQAKELLSNADLKQFCKDTVMEGLDNWAKARPQELLKVCKFLRDIAGARLKSETEKVKITAKYATSALSGLPDKYVKPKLKKGDDLELFIVEGDSALGSARSARDVNTQGIFPIRGKILNVFQASPQKIAANAEVMGIMQILGAGYGKNFKLDQVKFSKIIIMTDEQQRPKMLFA